jgi:hypothetical protein
MEKNIRPTIVKTANAIRTTLGLHKGEMAIIKEAAIIMYPPKEKSCCKPFQKICPISLPVKLVVSCHW